VPLQGGIPLSVGGEVVGAIGVSGASSADEDQELALAGAAAFAAALAGGNGANGASYFSSEALRQKFEEGGLLLDTAGFKLDAGRRVEAGEVEYHQRFVDVIHVVEGRATVLTGGELVEPREIAAGELRAPSLRGGVEHELAPGDVLAIPSGVPHQFVDVSDPFLYFVVKVEA
jgi:glc operon protein GlcG